MIDNEHLDDLIDEFIVTQVNTSLSLTDFIIDKTGWTRDETERWFAFGLQPGEENE